MAALMDLVAGKPREILLAVSVDDIGGLADPARFDAHLSLGGGLDPAWLDCFSEAIRDVTRSPEPRDFLDCRVELDGPASLGERIVERVDPGWVTAVAMLPDHRLDAIAGRWIDLVERDLGRVPRGEKEWIRQLAEQIVTFARRADRSPAVIFAWSL